MDSYTSALRSLASIAREASSRLRKERKSLGECVGRVAAEDLFSPVSTPAHDTSAMDGYAVSSEATASASPETPLLLEVCGTIAAGDDPQDCAAFDLGSDASGCLEPCVEIMTGGIFPTGDFDSRRLDACVKVEETAPVSDLHPGSHRRRITITKAVPRDANRRLAGADVPLWSLLLKTGTCITPQDVLVLASARISEVVVWSSPRVGVWSTGNEVASSSAGGIPDANGPYITATIRAVGAEATFLGILRDDEAGLSRSVQQAAESADFDLLITTGGVSVGNFDVLASSLRHLGADIVFHGLNIRPGHPALLGMLPVTPSSSSDDVSIPIFGLPGNPGAAAACLQFLVCPYLDMLRGRAPKKPILAVPTKTSVYVDGHQSTTRVLFRHGQLRQALDGTMIVELSPEQSPARLSPYLNANCWVRLDPGPLKSALKGHVPCYLMPGTASICL